MPIRSSRLPPVVDFSRAGYEADFYDSDGSEVVARNIPVLRLTDVDSRIVRVTPGIPLEAGMFEGIIPLTTEIASAGQVVLRSLRLGTSGDYDLVE